MDISQIPMAIHESVSCERAPRLRRPQAASTAQAPILKAPKLMSLLNCPLAISSPPRKPRNVGSRHSCCHVRLSGGFQESSIAASPGISSKVPCSVFLRWLPTGITYPRGSRASDGYPRPSTYVREQDLSSAIPSGGSRPSCTNRLCRS